MNINTVEYWDKKWREQWQAYEKDPRRDALYTTILGELGEGRAVLDLGGGCSRFSKLALQQGHSPTVADLSPWAIQHLAENGIDGIVLDVRDYDKQNLGKFDVAVCTELLEHLDSPDSALRVLNAHAPEAWISVPDNRMGPDELEEHQRKYTLSELAVLLQKYYHKVSTRSVHGYLLAHVVGPLDLPDVSILIPSTGRQTLNRTIQSLLDQSFKQWEAIVAFNNADKNPVIVDDTRIQFIDLGHIENDTGATARNEAFKYARGRLIATLDDDDWWEPSFLWVMRREHKKQGVDLLYCRTNLWGRDQAVQYGSWYREFDAGVLPKAGYILSPSVLFRRKLLDGYKLHADAGGRNSDWRFYVDRHRAGYTFGCVDKPLANLCVDERIWRHWAPGGFRGTE